MKSQERFEKLEAIYTIKLITSTDLEDKRIYRELKYAAGKAADLDLDDFEEKLRAEYEGEILGVARVLS